MFLQFNFRKIILALMALSLPLLLFNSDSFLQYAAMPVREFSHAVEWSLGSLSKGITNTVSSYTNLISVKKLNRELLNEISRLKMEQVLQEEIDLENKRLKKMLDLKSKSPMTLLAAWASSGDLISSSQALKLNRGRIQGVTENMGVLGLNGVIGETLQISQNRSQVLLITNRFFATEGLIQRSRQRIILEGSGSNTLLAQHIDSKVDIQIGDLVVTSGSNQVFPKGLPIGIVKTLNKRSSGITQEAEIEPLADIFNTEEFFIILNPGESISESE